MADVQQISSQSVMGYRTSGVLSCLFILCMVISHVNYDIRRYNSYEIRGNIHPKRTHRRLVNSTYGLSSRALPTKNVEDDIDIKISPGDVDVAIFTIRDYLVDKLPRRVHCHRWNRSITYRSAKFNVTATKDADVVMFTSGKGFMNMKYWSQLQSQRTDKQLWLLSTAEAAINTIRMWPPLEMRYMLMNLSSTFSQDSDIPIPYGEYIPFKEKRKIPFRSKLLNDSQNFAVWIASHCPLKTWNRSGIVHELSRYIPVDIYGKCGNLVCEWNDRRCLPIIRSYKFYLALENSCCKNYITEKLWQPLKYYDSIPVVIGATKEEYQRVAPPNSFIHIDDFSSLEHLADYLKTVASDLTLYRSYFEWKNYGYIQATRLYKSVWESNRHSCDLLEYAKGVRPVPSQGFDPFGPTWFRGCGPCGTQPWLRELYYYPSQTIYNRIQSQSNGTNNEQLQTNEGR